jgi:hypothetical protein
MNKRVFLLGGKDLEMSEIQKILSNNHEIFENKDLSWGAKLSDYRDDLEKYNNDEITIYGIELEEDIKIPKKYIEIDHHGKNDDKASSLEQVAKILNIELSKEQKLIAANDSRYIAGMQNLCATKDEIKEIRKKDREAQGITFEDEELAKESFEITCNNNSNLIYSKTSKFSAVSDLAYYKFDNYVIYNNEKILFYGYKKSNILEFLESQNIDESNYYYGGGEFGFIGVKDNVLCEDEINNILEEFKKFDKKDELYSYHTFMFPFTFKSNFKKTKSWEYKPFEISKQKDFNEYVYFYKHIQDAIYNKDNENNESNEKWISKYYEYEFQKGTYSINCKKGIFELELDGLSLRIFNTDVGILSFNLKNTKYSDKNSILAINDFGRRIYPQFLGEKFTFDTKNAILSNCITLELDNKVIREDFTKFNDMNSFKELKKLNLLPSFISELIEDNFSKDEKNLTTIRPIIDDRMFVISLYMNDALITELQNYKECSNQYEYETNDFWYKYIFIDGDEKTCQSKHMTKKLISESTYDRWVEWGTLFGISRYSFVSITGSWFGKNRLLPHFQTMYFQIFTLLLAYRATIIKFADEIQDATSSDNTISAKSKIVYNKYLNFLNKLYFKEITAQDQGIELYNQAMKIMDIEKYMNDLDNEINELHNYVSMIEEEKKSQESEKINKKLENIQLVGGVLLGASVLTGFFGMNVGGKDDFSWLIVLPTLIISTWYGYQKFYKGEK